MKDVASSAAFRPDHGHGSYCPCLLPNSLRSEKYLAQLTADSRIRLTNGALNLVIPDWRSLGTGKVTFSKEAR